MIAEKFGLIVIEDACQALLSKTNNLFLGTQSATGCFSLGVTKLITTGQGGVVVTNDSNIYEKLLLIRNNGMQNILTPEYKMFGANFKFSDVLINLILSPGLKSLFPTIGSKKCRNFLNGKNSPNGTSLILANS